MFQYWLSSVWNFQQNISVVTELGAGQLGKLLQSLFTPHVCTNVACRNRYPQQEGSVVFDVVQVLLVLAVGSVFVQCFDSYLSFEEM